MILDLISKISTTPKTQSSYSSASSPTNPNQLWILIHPTLGVQLQTITSVFLLAQGSSTLAVHQCHTRKLLKNADAWATALVN